MNSLELESLLRAASIALLMAKDFLKEEKTAEAEKSVEYATELIIECNLSFNPT